MTWRCVCNYKALLAMSRPFTTAGNSLPPFPLLPEPGKHRCEVVFMFMMMLIRSLEDESERPNERIDFSHHALACASHAGITLIPALRNASTSASPKCCGHIQSFAGMLDHLGY